MPARLPLLLPILLAASLSVAAPRNDWYWSSPVNIHWDNHSGPLGQGMTVDEIAALFEGLRVDMIQVSARSTPWSTYPTEVGLPNPKLEGYDTMATWRAVTRKLDTRLCVYLNSIDEPQMFAQHPDWQQVDATGRGDGVCNRPSADGSGYLERIMIPTVQEIIARYDPDGFWYDGDYHVRPTCYCPHCKAAWKAQTGKAEPPTDARDPDWPAWVRLERQRYDDYRHKLADAIHAASDHCMYTSNWSWAISYREPGNAPDWADTLSGDVGGGSSAGALYGLRAAALMLSAQEHTPHDVMSAIYPKAVRSLPRMLQEGGLVMASGSSWFLWVNTLVPQQFDHLRACTGLVNDRRAALGRTHSLNPIAVVMSETTADAALTHPERGYFDSATPRNLAFALQDCGYGVDLVNEETLREQPGHYQVVCVPEQRLLADETLQALRNFVTRGGTLLVTGAGLRPADEDPAPVADLLGLRRTARQATPVRQLRLGDSLVPLRYCWQMKLTQAVPLATFADGTTPALTVRPLGAGRVAYLALSGFRYPDDDDMAGWLMNQLKVGPMVSVSGPARDRHLVFALRRRADSQAILHCVDLTSRVAGKLIEPNSRHDIEPQDCIPEIAVSLRCPTAPRKVSVVPAASTVKSSYRDGLLRLTLGNVTTHAAVILDMPPAKVALLPAGTSLLPPRSYEREMVLLDEDFEGTAPGKVPALGIWSANVDAKTAIRVSEVTAAGGKRSLEFVDDPAARASFVPYLVLAPRGLDRGRARFACDLRLPAGSRVDVELRDGAAGPYIVGPSLRFDEQGKLRYGGKELGTYAPGQWFRLTLDFALGGIVSTCDVTIAEPGKPEVRHGPLAYADPGFASCTWLGIIGYSPGPVKFYVDNIRLERLP